MNAFQFAQTLFYSQFIVTPPIPTTSFANQTIIVRGSNTGIGYEAVKHFIRLDAAKIILAVRSTSKAKSAVQQIIASMNCNPSRLEVWEFDLGGFESIRAFVARAGKLERLDTVVQNAGIMAPMEWTVDGTGTETTLKVNTLGPIYFSYAILPKLRASAEKTGLMGRLSLNGSDIMFISGLVNQEIPGSLIDAMNDLAQAKTFGDRCICTNQNSPLLFYVYPGITKPLRPREGSNVLINVVTPEATKSDFFTRHEKGWYEAAILSLMNLMSRETDVGARTLVHAVEPDLSAEAHGQFLMDSTIMMKNPMLGSDNAEAFQGRWQKELLPLSEKMQPEVTKI